MLQTRLRRQLKQLLTSRSFTTIEPDESEERRLHLLQPQSQSADMTHERDHPDIPMFRSSKRGINLLSIDRTPLKVDRSDETTQTDISMADDEKLSWRSQPQTYTTSLYVDCLGQVVNVPLEKDTEVMVVLDRSRVKSCLQSGSGVLPSAVPGSPSQNVGGRHFVSMVEVESSVAANGRQVLTPVNRTSMEVTRGQPRGQWSSPGVMERSSGQRMTDIGGDRHHLDSVVCHSMFSSTKR